LNGTILTYIPDGGINVDRRPADVEVPLAHLQGAVGGNIEAVRPGGYGTGTWACCNEERWTVPTADRKLNAPFAALTGDRRVGRIIVLHGFASDGQRPDCPCVLCTRDQAEEPDAELCCQVIESLLLRAAT